MRVWVWIGFLALAACARGKGAEEAARAEVYLGEVKQLLQELRALDQQIARQITADTLDSRLIIPLIRQQFQPVVARLRDRVAALDHPPPVEAAHQQLLGYLGLRLEAYELAIRGEEEKNSEMFAQFSRLQLEADTAGRKLEEELRRLNQRFR